MDNTAVEILLIEDNPHEAELTLRTLKKNNVANNVKHIDDGADAVDFIFNKNFSVDATEQRKPKLIILDLKLPKVSGLEILKRLKSDERTNLIPVVVLTSSQEDNDVLESYKLGVNSYVVKPVNFDSFSKAIAQLGLYWMLINQDPFN